MISTTYNFLFIHIPKTAGNSIQSVLSAYSDDRIVCAKPYHDGIERFEIQSDRLDTHKHSTLSDYEAQIEGHKFQSLFKFAGVRNPWDRAISFYFSPHRGPATWNRDEFARLLGGLAPMSHYLKVSTAQVEDGSLFRNVDRFIRFENLEEDFKAVCGLIRIPHQPLVVRNRSVHRGYREYYDDELRQMIAEKFKSEIDHFGYQF